MKMTRAGIRALKFASRSEHRDDDFPGLWLTALPSGILTWSCRYRFDGRDRRFVIGRFPQVDIGTARRVAGDVLRRVATGVDPQAVKIQQRRRARAGLDRPQTFGSVFEDYLKQHVRADLKPSTAAEMERLARSRILPKLARQELNTIEPRQLKALMPGSITGNRVHATLRSFFNWCVAELIISDSPMSGLKKPRPEKARDRVLTDIEIKIFWLACDRMPAKWRDLYQLLLLTGQRRGEVAGMTLHEIDRRRSVWSLAASRTKNKRRHEVAITKQFGDILDRDTLPFMPLHNWARHKRALDQHMSEIADEYIEPKLAPWRLHDLRRTCASGMAACGVSLPVIERCLNHISGSFGGIVSVYQKHEYADDMRAA